MSSPRAVFSVLASRFPNGTTLSRPFTTPKQSSRCLNYISSQAPSTRTGSQHRPMVTSSSPKLKRDPLPLEGVTVVSLEHAIAAPFCTRQLADMGARVIKIERPGVGDFARAYDTRVNGMASHFVWANRSKESLALDLKKPKDFEVLKKLLAKSDVLVQNLAPGATERLGLGYDTLKDTHPSLIVCDISGYGSDGPYRDKKAYDLLVQSEAGFLSVTGNGPDLAKAGISIADISAGMYAYANILAAVIKRGKTGKGTRIDISMLESMVEWMNFPLYYTYNGAPGLARSGAAHASIYPYGPFETGGSGSVMLGVQNEREWANLCRTVLGDEALAKDPRFVSNTLRVKNRDELKEIISKQFAKFSAEEVLKKLDSASIANANVNDMQGVWEHPQLRARGRWTDVETPGGTIPALIPPGFASVEASRMERVPELGEHNEAIFEELGVKP
ncbi:CoA-transferase family III [Colletotrichum abscissum]|uniref:CoA-transferase family III n=1 Tax=Colletotrichum abscissum TaxID=1671311 RepID=A0A9P9XQG2_9PEZI|nr:CoA-transferase family III [Colletotrichum abscissum]KAI3558532.1 CoA-transferase family III [Colletotrichum abscissum]KAK1511553.1 CoA-transferase family III [Colletotrichum abscissum]